MKHRVAIAHASGMVAAAILEKLPESGLEPDSLVLLDDDANAGTRLSYAGTRHAVQAQQGFDYSSCALLLLPEADSEIESAALAQGCLLVSHAIARDAPALFMVDAEKSPRISYTETSLRLPGPELCCLLPALLQLNRRYALAQLNITLLRSAEFYGKPGIDELAGQTIDLLNAREARSAVYPQQIAFNIFPQAVDTRLDSDLREHLGTISYSPVLQTLNVPVFHGFAAAVQLRFETDVVLDDCRRLLAALDNVVIKKGLASPVFDCNQSFSCVISQLEQAAKKASGLQFWMLADPMRYGLANNYVNVTEFLLKSFL